MGLTIESFMNGNKSKTLAGIFIASLPTKIKYRVGDILDLSGMVVTAFYTSGETVDVIDYTTFPAVGSTLNTKGDVTVTVSYTEKSIIKTASFTISVATKIVTWTNGSDEDVSEMITAAHNGELKLSDYWTVGDIRTVSLSAGTNSAGTAIPIQSVELVLVHKLTSTKYYGGGEFIINQKNCLTVKDRMNPTDTSVGSFAGSAIANFLNNTSTGYLAMLPNWLRNCLLTASVITAQSYDSTINQKSEHKVFLPAEKEIFEIKNCSIQTEFDALEQWEWFKTSTNRIKQVDGSNAYWWLRSPWKSAATAFCLALTDGTGSAEFSSVYDGIAPAMLI